MLIQSRLSPIFCTTPSGSSASVSVVTFATPYTTGVPPDCVVTSPTGTAITSYAVTATTLTINTASTTGSFTYMCMQ